MESLIGIIIAAIIAGVVYFDASKREMNAFWWSVGVFFIMILFLPIYLIVRKPEKI